MAFCSECGCQLTEEAKFCHMCGTKVDTNYIPYNSERKIVYDGEVHKCPSCGEPVDSLTSHCRYCGHELRGINTTQSVMQFAIRLDKAVSEDQRIALVRSFPIPNTREDIFEYIILASTNLNGQENKALFDAWLVKFEQCYQKAKLVFNNDSDFERIQSIYNDTTRQISKNKAMLGISIMGNILRKTSKMLSNPIFAIVFIMVCYSLVQAIFSGEFSPIHIIIFTPILLITYFITNIAKKK